MQVAIVGLGRMGKNIALHLLEQGVSVVAYNRTKDDVDEVVKAGAIGAYSLEEIPQKFTEQPIVAILYIPSGGPTEEVLFGVLENKGVVRKGLTDILPQGSIIIDGGNSFFKDSQRRGKIIAEKGLHFLDMGTSGGLEGARNGGCLMVGGNKLIYEQVEPLLAKIATKDGYGYFGPAGAGHFVKMIHNAVEYGMMGSIAEGLGIISNFQYPISNEKDNNNFKFDLAKVAKVWAHGSIVSGLLMDKMAAALEKNPTLEGISGEVPRGETESEMEWVGKTGIPNPVIQQARLERVESRTKPSLIGKLIAALRREFGGHAVKEEK